MRGASPSIGLFGAAENPARTAAIELWLTLGRFALLLGLLLLAIHADVVLGSRSFFYRDYGMFGYPLAYYHRASFWQGEVPLWNPLNNCGLPFLAQWNTMVFYPFSLLYLVLPLPWGLNYFCLGHLFLAGLTMFALAHRWTGSRLGAGVAGIGYALNGLTLHSLMWPNNIAALAWLPLIILMVERAWKNGGRSVLSAAAISAVQMLTGAPEIILFTWMILGVLWAGDLILTWRRSGQRFSSRAWLDLQRPFVRFVTVVLIVGGLAAVQLLPFLDLLRHSHRDNNFGQSAWPMPGWGWANLLVPLFHCSISIAGVYSQNEQQWTSSYYLGIGILALAILAAWSCRRWRVWFLTAVTLFGLIMALGEQGHLFAWVKQVFPGVGLARFPVKFVVLAMFSLPLLAAFGVQAVLQRRTSRSLMTVCAALLVLIGGVVLFAQAYPWQDENLSAVIRSGAGRAGLLLALLGLVAGWTWLSLRLPAWTLSYALLIVPGMDALTHTPRQNPTVENWVYDPDLQVPQTRPSAGQSRAMVSPEFQAFLEYAATPDPAEYCLGHRRALLANWNLLAGVAVVNGFYSLYAREQWEVWSILYSRREPFPAGLADYLGVSQVSSESESFAWTKRESARPIITAGQRPTFADPPTVLAALKSPEFKPAESLYLPREAGRIVTATGRAQAKVIASRITPAAIEVDVVSDAPALVSIAQTGYHCWRAFVDGHPAKIWPANHAFQALEVPAGTHHVQLVYVDNAFRCGAVLSVLTLVAFAGAWFFTGRPQTRKPSALPPGQTVCE